jgi:acetate kinase
MKILVFNCGSSSLKFALFDFGSEKDGKILSRGEFEAIGKPSGQMTIESAGAKRTKPSPNSSHADAAIVVLDEIASASEGRKLDAIAHRVVHGGPDIVAPTLLTDEVLQKLESGSRFAPLHNPPALDAIRATGTRVPGVLQIVVTDTAFHQTMPDFARTYPIPLEMANRHGIRRFGFHGVGHGWMTQRYVELSGKPISSLNLITLQLGAGCSAAAIRGGRSVDTSMGLTPLEGLMMATRSGSIDPAIFPYLSEQEHLSPRQLEDVLNHQSGFLGVSGVSGDLREVVEAKKGGDSRADLAINLFCYRVRQNIGAYMAIPGAPVAVIFGGGIGEHSPEIRALICGQLEHLGIRLDPALNHKLTGMEGRFSATNSPIELWVIPLQEELFIARAARDLVSASGARTGNGAN